MATQSFNAHKFSLVETFCNNNGKTSSAKLVGLATSFTAMVVILVMVVFYMFNVAQAATILAFVDRMTTIFGISAGLMGVKSISSSFGKNGRTITIGGDNQGGNKQSSEEIVPTEADDGEADD